MPNEWARYRRVIAGHAEFGDLYYPGAIYTIHNNEFGDDCVLGNEHWGVCQNIPPKDEFITENRKNKQKDEEIL